MTKIDIFCQMFRDASLISKIAAPEYVRAVGFIMLNSRQLTNYIETTDIPMEQTVGECLAYFYNHGPKPRLLVMNGL